MSRLFLRFREFVVVHLCDGLLGALWAPLANSLCRRFLSAAPPVSSTSTDAPVRDALDAPPPLAVHDALDAPPPMSAVVVRARRARCVLRRLEFLLEVSALGVIECVEFLLRVRFGVEKAPRLGRVSLPAALLPVVLLVSEDVRFLLSPIQLLLPRL